MSSPPPNRCASCGRLFEWRAKWREVWDEVRYCSDRCRRSKPGRIDRELERAIETLLGERARGATICPSEAARVVRPEGWRELMERTRSAAGRLVGEGAIEVVQKGRVVEIGRARGPIRLRAAAVKTPSGRGE